MDARLFRSEQVERTLHDRSFCLACKPVRPARNYLYLTSVALMICGALLVGLGQMTLGAGGGIGISLIMAAGWTAWGPIHLFVHEAGHAIMAALLGHRVASVRVGDGEDLVRLQLADTELRIGRNLLSGGMVRHYAAPGSARWRATLIALGGVFANIAVAALVASLLILLGPQTPEPIGAPLGVLAASFVFVELVRTPAALIPRHVKSLGQRLPSDGLSIFRLWRRKRDLDAEALLFDFLECRRHIDAARWPEALAQIELAICRHPEITYFRGALLHVIGRKDGREAVVQYFLRHREELEALAAEEPAGMANALGNAAWQMVRLRDPSLIATALHLSERAAADDPSCFALRATHGASLMANGDPSGRDKLLAAIPEIEDAEDRAEFIAFLADEAAANGDPASEAALRGLEAHLLKAA